MWLEKSGKKNILSLSRSLHRKMAPIVAVPALLILVTGVILQLKSIVPGVQPALQKGSGTTPSLDFHQIYQVAKSVPEAQVLTWKEIHAIDVRPAQGVIRVRTKGGYEVQMDAQSGAILGHGPRRTGFLISLHEGSLFGGGVKYGVYLPSAILLVSLWITGMILYCIKPSRKRRTV